MLPTQSTQHKWPSIPYPEWRNVDDVEMVDISQLDPTVLAAKFPEDRRDRAFNVTLRARLKAVIDDLEADLQFSPDPLTTLASSSEDSDQRTTAARLTHLRHLHNACNFISSLPPEILIEIFGHYSSLIFKEEHLWPCSSANPEDFTRRLHGRPYRWIRVTHVCRHWRQVALGAASLWSRIAVTSRSDCLTEMIQRSKNCPIYLVLKALPQDEMLSQALMTLQRCSPNLHTLDVRSTSEEVLATMANTFVPGSRLRRLIVIHERETPRRRSGIQQAAFPLPFLHPGMELEELWYELPYAIWCNAIAIPSLRCLKLYGRYYAATFSISNIILAISKMSKLEELHLVNVLPTPSQRELPLVSVADHRKGMTVDPAFL